MNRILIWIALSTVVLLLLASSLLHRSYNVVLITIDTLRADFLSCYNTRTPATPNIDGIANEGILFRNAYSLIPITTPAHAVILTSRFPHELKVFNNREALKEKVPTLTELLAKRGYSTAAFISLGVLSRRFQLDRGFETYEDDFIRTSGRWYKVASEINALAIPWIERMKKDHFFAWIHYSDPHEPYIPVGAPPDTEIRFNGNLYGKYCLAKREKYSLKMRLKPGENTVEFKTIPGLQETGVVESTFIYGKIKVKPSEAIELRPLEVWENQTAGPPILVMNYRKRAVIRLLNKRSETVTARLGFSGEVTQRLDVILNNYAREVQYVDRNVGSLVQKLHDLGIWNKTILIVTADHGEGLMTHGTMGHVYPLYNENVHVPLIIYYPGWGRRSESVSQVVDHLDIMPTVLDLLQIRNNSLMRGESLASSVAKRPMNWFSVKNTGRSPTFISTYTPQAKANSFALIDGNLKLIQKHLPEAWESELYDLSQDPAERKNLCESDPACLADQRLGTLRTSFRNQAFAAELAHEHRSGPTLTAEEKEMLMSLGYLASEDR